MQRVLCIEVFALTIVVAVAPRDDDELRPPRTAPTSITPDPVQLRALSHPLRLRLLGMLRTDGPATATSLAARLGLSTGATSYHLRQLAEHGFIEDDRGRGGGRQRWWRATARTTHVEEPTDAGGDDQEVLDAFWQAALVQHVQALQRGVEARSGLDPRWRRALGSHDTVVYPTLEQAEELDRRVRELLAFVDALPLSREDADEGAARVGVQVHVYPFPEVGPA